MTVESSDMAEAVQRAVTHGAEDVVTKVRVAQASAVWDAWGRIKG